MKALSVKQPWAMAICHGKDVENRTWETQFCGPVAIHASKAFDNVSDDTLKWIVEETGLSFEEARAQDHRGAVVAVAEIVGCHINCGYEGHIFPGMPPVMCSPWAMEGQWHWELDNVQVLRKPVPARGALGLWRLPDAVDYSVRAQLTRSVNATTGDAPAASSTNDKGEADITRTSPLR